MKRAPDVKQSREGARCSGEVVGKASLCVALLGASACAGSADTLRLLANERERLVDMPAFVQQLGPVRPADASAIAVGSRDDELVGLRWDPDNSNGGAQPSWRRAAAVTQPAIVAGEVVVFGEGTRFAALDAASGEPLWSSPARGAELIAVADDGAFTALTLHHPRTNTRSLAVLDRRGDELLELEADAQPGAPALLRGTLLVPWGAFISAVDVSYRAEVARARMDIPFQHVTWVLGGLFLGGPPWIELGVTPSPPYVLARRPLPGRVHAGPERVLGPDADVTRLYVQPRALEGGGAPPTSGDIYLATYGRIAMGIDARQGALQWVLALPGRALAGAPLPGAFAVCDETGVLRVLEAVGAGQRWQARLAEPPRRARAALTACSLVGAARALERSVRDVGAASPAIPLLDQLARVLSLPDRELLDAQRFLSRELAARPEPEATRVLIDLATRRSADPILQTDAEDLLATRRNGAEFMLRALASASPSGPDPLALAPLGPLADALGALGESRAAPLLAEQLNHPGHSAGALARAAAALEQLAGEAEYANLSVFFSLHRTIANQPERVEAVNAIGRTLLRIGGERGRTLVQNAARDPLTAQEVRRELLRALGDAPASSAPPGGRYGAVALGRKEG
jgi:hypothetical protein